MHEKRKSIPLKTKLLLWGKSAGRCQYDGCNAPQYIDQLTKSEFNTAYIAHIIADSPNGPRGHITLSKRLEIDINNLMLLCDKHHRLIDIAEVREHTVERLQKMKKEHEERIFQLTNISKDKEAHVVLFGANIGSHNSLLNRSHILQAMTPNYYPTLQGEITLGLGNSSFQDDTVSFWNIEVENLTTNFQQKVLPLIQSHHIQNFCVFGIAPQPLLIKFGTLLSDISNIEIFNPQKEPKTWKWNEGFGNDNFFTLIKPKRIYKNIALVFSLSGSINENRITSVLGKDVSIWEISINNPNNDFMKFKNHLSQFRFITRNVLDTIKKQHGENSIINIFPAMLPSTAIELGRVWNPKADLPLTIYDQNKKLGGFIKTIEIT